MIKEYTQPNVAHRALHKREFTYIHIIAYINVYQKKKREKQKSDQLNFKVLALWTDILGGEYKGHNKPVQSQHFGKDENENHAHK